MKGWRLFPAVAAMLLALAGHARAELRYELDSTYEGVRFIIVSGEFGNNDDLGKFDRLVAVSRPTFVVFNSPGGLQYKAMEFGRLVRQRRLITFQLREFDCMSACALAFLGGVARHAEPGTIGVHQSSFEAGAPLDTSEAVSAVQQLTAEMLYYLDEMGVDPALLQLALSYDSSDMRFLSGSEMAELGVTTPTPPHASWPVLTATPSTAPTAASSPAATPRADEPASTQLSKQDRLASTAPTKPATAFDAASR